MKSSGYRMASWWLLWEDIIFPENGVKDKILKRVAKFKNAGIDTVVIFGAHFRWDYIYNWERVHLLLDFIIDECHKNGIKVFDHHSAVLTHRVSNIDEYENVNRTNRHHVPFFPSRDFAENLMFNGHKLNSFRMQSVRTGEACYLDAYNAESYCMNNTNFVESYLKYLDKLLAETDIDGLMCDDVIYYPGWDGCGCEFCRAKFKNVYGYDLPPVADESFWGNYESPAFKAWIEMRYNDPVDFLKQVQAKLGKDFPLMSCCSSSSAKVLNGYGLNAITMSAAENNVMLEICGEIVSEDNDFIPTVPDFMLHKAVAVRGEFPNIGLGYAHNPDTAFLVWAFNKLFASSTWVSTLTGRMGLPEEIRKQLPDEADVISKAYNFEKDNADLFAAESSAEVAVFFSIRNVMYNGCAQSSYSQPWADCVAQLFKNNIQFDVVCEIPEIEKYPVLVLINCDCMSRLEMDSLDSYIENGGKVIALGLTGFRDEKGNLRNKAYMSKHGVELLWYDSDWKIGAEKLFDIYQRCPQSRELGYSLQFEDKTLNPSEWLELDNLLWFPGPCVDLGAKLVEAEVLVAEPVFKVDCSCGWYYRIMKGKGSRYYIHFINSKIAAVPYEGFQNNLLNKPVVEKLVFEPEDASFSVNGEFSLARLHSPDLDLFRELCVNGGKVVFTPDDINRYFILELS